MSRLDDLKRARDRLQKALDAGIDAFYARHEQIYPYSEYKYKEFGPLYSDFPPELKSMVDANSRIHYKIDAIDKQIREEEKKLPTQKAGSYRPQRYQDEERVCSRCGSPLSRTQVLCLYCLTNNP